MKFRLSAELDGIKENDMAYSNMQYMRDTYGVPAKRGMRVKYTGGKTPRMGTITGTGGCGIMVRLDGDKISLPYHPKWKLEYMPPNTGGKP